MPDISRKQVGFNLPLQTVRRLRYQAVAEERTMSEIVSEALSTYLDAHPLDAYGSLQPPHVPTKERH
jgi:hypothetical protein